MFKRSSSKSPYHISLPKGCSFDGIAASTNAVSGDIVLCNHTNFYLHPHQTIINSGEVKLPAVAVADGTQEVMRVEKKVGLYGAEGVVTWKIGNTGKMLAVMWSLPYSRVSGLVRFYNNQLGVGVFDVAESGGVMVSPGGFITRPGGRRPTTTCSRSRRSR